MKSFLLNFYIPFFCLFCFIQTKAQTQGTLSFSFTPTSHGTGNHALAIWIGPGSAGGLLRTMNRFCDASTYNYLPTWAGFANCGFQGTTLDATSVICHTGGATLGGSLSSYSQINIVWDGLNNYGNLSQDDICNVAIEETWGTGATKTAVRYFSFVKKGLR